MRSRFPNSGLASVVKQDTPSVVQYLCQSVWFHVDVKAKARLNGPTRVETAAPENSGSGHVANGIHDSELKRQVPRAHAFHPRRATAIPLKGQPIRQ